jgi:integrase/recombinase XerD
MNLYHALDSYLTYLTAERGASPHTVDAYNRDIISFIKFLEERGLPLSENTDRSCIEAYIGHVREQGKKNEEYRTVHFRVKRAF